MLKNSCRLNYKRVSASFFLQFRRQFCTRRHAAVFIIFVSFAAIRWNTVVVIRMRVMVACKRIYRTLENKLDGSCARVEESSSRLMHRIREAPDKRVAHYINRRAVYNAPFDWNNIYSIYMRDTEQRTWLLTEIHLFNEITESRTRSRCTRIFMSPLASTRKHLDKWRGAFIESRVTISLTNGIDKLAFVNSH